VLRARENSQNAFCIPQYYVKVTWELLCNSKKASLAFSALPRNTDIET
jgi:hypothetical protein